MRLLVLLPALLAAVPVTAPEDVAAPASEPTYGPATQATIDWIAEMEATTASAPAALPPLEPPTESHVPGTGIRRCAGPDGNTIFTDKRCEDMGGVDSAAPTAGNASTRLFVRSCARTREALVDGLRDALGARDPNRVASYYHWTGMGNRAAYALMERLYGFSQRPVMDVQLVVSEAREATREGDVPPLGWYPMLPSTEPRVEEAPPRRAPAPDLVRVDQMRGDKDVASEVTYFHLQANAGCWWIRY
jgi:hypothetical protein